MSLEHIRNRGENMKAIKDMRKVKDDCFAYDNGCTISSREDCAGCSLYKESGTECDTCNHKGKETCMKCHE